MGEEGEGGGVPDGDEQGQDERERRAGRDVEDCAERAEHELQHNRQRAHSHSQSARGGGGGRTQMRSPTSTASSWTVTCAVPSTDARMTSAGCPTSAVMSTIAADTAVVISPTTGRSTSTVALFAFTYSAARVSTLHSLRGRMEGAGQGVGKRTY